MPRLAGFRCLASICLVALFARESAAGASFVYALGQVNGGANQIFGFRLDPLTGTLTALPSMPVATGGTGTTATAAEQLVFGGGRLFAVNDGSDTLSVFAVNSATGGLTAMPFSPVALGAGDWGSVAVHATGSPVVVGNGNPAVLASFNITSTAVTSASGSPFAMGIGANPFSIAFSRDGNFVYAGGNAGNAIASFSVDPGTGVLTPLSGSPFIAGDFPLAYATDSAGRLFISNTVAGRVQVFTTSSGVPTGVTGNPFLSGLSSPIRAVLHQAGFYLVADRVGNQVGVYQISGSGSGTTLSAVGGSPFGSDGSTTNTLALAPEGSLLVAGNSNSRNLTVFQVNSSTGGLMSLGVQAANTLGSSGLITGLALAPGPTLGDLDADRNGDVLWRNRVTGQNIGWLMNGATVTNSAFLPTIADTNWQVRGVGDFAPNGKADLIWRNGVTGQNIVWLMEGLSVGFAAFLPTIADTNWEIKGVGDFDADAKADVIWRNRSTGQNIGWLMNVAAVATSAFLPTIADTNWEIAGVGDFENNANADVIWRNRATGQNIAWLMNGLAVSLSAFLPTIADTNWEIRGVGDLDADGRADVVWRNRSTGQNIAWLMNGTVVSSSAFLTTIADTNWEIKSVRDLNADSKSDVVWRNRMSGQNIAWLMNGFTITTAAFLPTIADTNWEIVGQ